MAGHFMDSLHSFISLIIVNFSFDHLFDVEEETRLDFNKILVYFLLEILICFGLDHHISFSNKPNINIYVLLFFILF